MAFPAGWPPRPSSASRNIHFYVEATADSSFSNNAFLFSQGAGANALQPLPYVAPGSSEPVHLGAGNKSSFPLGAGQEARDAQGFNPNVFIRGTGSATAGRVSFTQSGNTTTFNDKNSIFTPQIINREIRIQNATSGGNDGTFVISAVLDQHTIQWENVSGVTEDFPAAGDYRIRVIEEAVPVPAIWANTIRVHNTGANAIQISFDGVNIHNYVAAGDTLTFRDMGEAGIAVKAVAGTSDVIIEAW